MKNTFYHFLIIGSAAALALAGCKNGGASSSDDNAIVFSDIHASRAYVLEGSAEDFMRDDDVNCVDSVSLIMPQALLKYDIKPLQDSILSVAFDTVGADVDKVIDGYFNRISSDYGYVLKEGKAGAGSLFDADGYTLVSGEVVSLSSSLLTYCVTSSSYTSGAAHGMSVRRYLCYSLDDGKIIALSDLFTGEGLRALPSLIQSQADRMTSVLGITTISSLPADDNFYLTGNGDIIFAYQPYEVASYAQGEVKVPFYPYELAQYMTPYALSLFSLDNNQEMVME